MHSVSTPEPRPSGVASATVTGAWSALALWIVVRPCLWGASPLEELAFLTCAAALILPAGWCAWRALRGESDDVPLTFGMSWALGLALLALVYVALASCGLERGIVAWPFASALGAWTLSRRERERAPRVASANSGALSPWVHATLVAILLCTVERSQLVAASQWWRAWDTDIQFHIGNATALHAGLPLEDPRVAGWPFHYHHYAYSSMNAVRQLGGFALSDQMERLGTSLAPLLVVLQTFNAARTLGGSAVAGLIAAALVALHIDPGAHAGLFLGLKAYAVSFGSVFHCGVYNSPSAALMLAYFASFVIVLARWLETGRRAALLVLALLALACAGTKAAGMPVVVVALFAAAAFGLWRRREGSSRAWLAASVALLGALPTTLALAFAKPSFADAMLRWAPWQMLRASGSFVPVLRGFGYTRVDAPWTLATAFAPLWMIGFFGLAAVAAITWIVVRRRSLQLLELFLVASALAGAFIGLGYSAPGFSQLFSLYPGQLALALLAGVGLASASFPRVWKAISVLVLGVPLVVNATLELWTIARSDLSPKGEEPALCASYRQGLEWLRDETPRDAVVIARTSAMIASVLAERAGFFETSAYTAESYAAGWVQRGGWWVWHPPQTEPFAARVDLVQRFFAGPDAANVREIRAAAGSRRALYAIVDRLQLSSSNELGPFYAFEPVGDLRLESQDVALKLVFENEALRIYAVDAR